MTSAPSTCARDPVAFIRANTRLLPVPHAPEIVLHVADEATALWQKTEEELQEIGLPPPFWAFAWAGGQALARHLLDHPERVAGKSVLDFASGSGLVAIAAAKAGAARVLASDLDPFALHAIPLNAAANGLARAITVTGMDLIGMAGDWDCVLAADICYERDLAQAVTDWLHGLHAGDALVLIGDPGRSYLPHDRLEAIATYAVPVTRSLEDAEIKRSSVWRFRSCEAASSVKGSVCPTVVASVSEAIPPTALPLSTQSRAEKRATHHAYNPVTPDVLRRRLDCFVRARGSDASSSRDGTISSVRSRPRKSGNRS